MTKQTSIRAVAFDLGHVVLDADIPTQIKNMGITAPWTALAQWKGHWDFETGKISTQDFFNQAQAKFNLTLPHPELLIYWNAIILGYVPGMREVLNELHGKTRIVAITNTNPPHFEVFHQMPGFENFEIIFASHKLGLRKPDKEIYQHVLNELAIKPQELLFFDDLPENVAAASQLGIHAYECLRSSQFVRDTLKKFLILD